MTQPTKAECFDRFWNIIAREHLEACRREAAEAAKK